MVLANSSRSSWLRSKSRARTNSFLRRACAVPGLSGIATPSVAAQQPFNREGRSQMPRGNSFVDDDPSTFPLHVRLAYDQSLAWRAEGHCIGLGGELRLAWSVLAKEEIVVGDSVYLGAQLIDLALEYCKACPVQYHCSRYALNTAPSSSYIWGTWGAPMADLRWVKQHDLGYVVDDAERDGVPVQVALKQARKMRRVPAA